MDRSLQVPLTPGLVVDVGERPVRITHVLGIDGFLAADVSTGEIVRHRTSDVTSIPPEATQTPDRIPADLSSIPDLDWGTAQKRLMVVQALLSNPDRRRKDVEDAAREAGATAATVYRWIHAYEASGSVTSLIPRKRGRPSGTRLIPPEAEALLQSAIEREYLSKRQKKAAPVITAVARDAEGAGIAAPHPATIRRRLKALDRVTVLRRRGDRDGAKALTPAFGHYPETTRALQVVQIDHTNADIVVLDDDRQPTGRPFLTLAIDVHTRMIVGFVVAHEKPSAATVGACISQIILPKGPVLAALGVSGDWPVWGCPEKIQTDNAKEFDSRSVRRACEQYGIAHDFRPVGRPEFGGHIERLMLTTAQEIQTIPGTTFSNVRERRQNDPEKEAVLTLDEFETLLAEWIVNTYNVRFHRTIGTAPLRKLRESVEGTGQAKGTGMPPMATDHARVRIDFFPSFERTIQRTGVQIDGKTYFGAALTPFIDSKDPAGATRKFVFRRDPWKVGSLWFWNPVEKTYVELHSSIDAENGGSMTAWDLREAKKRLKANKMLIDERSINESHRRREKMIADGEAQTKSERRKQRMERQRQRAARRADLRTPHDPPNLRHAAPAPVPNAARDDDDIFSTPVERPAVIDLNPGRR